MTDFEAIITANYTDREETDTVTKVRANIARDLYLSVYADNCRGYL
jgi:hypothetical protein